MDWGRAGADGTSTKPSGRAGAACGAAICFFRSIRRNRNCLATREGGKVAAKALDKAVFPGLQGGPHNQTTAAIAVALHEAARPSFRDYAHSVVANAKALAAELLARGFDLVSGGTDNHLILSDLTSKQIPGKVLAQALDRAGIVCNYNTVPFDPRRPFGPSGIRLGTPALTSRGMGPDQMVQIAAWSDAVAASPGDTDRLDAIAAEVEAMAARFSAPGLPTR